MPFVGLQPIIDKIRLPQSLRSPLELQGGGAAVPCFVVSSRVSSEYIIPTEPVDSNQYVSDTIITRPVAISLDLFVYENEANDFFELVDTVQRSNEGFVFIDRKGRKYQNLYITSYGHTESAESVGAFDVQMELQQVLRVVSQQGTAPIKQGQPGGKPVSQGSSSSELVKTEPPAPKEPNSILYDVTKRSKEGISRLIETLGFGS